jgi:FkbM family methyltransferase
MNKNLEITLRLIKKAFSKIKFRRSQTVDACLSPTASVQMGCIPTALDGNVGHNLVCDIFFDIIEIIKPQIFCDIGANKGEAGRRAKNRLAGLQVFSFEANPEIFEMYRDVNVKHGISWNNLAISNKKDVISLYIPRVLERALKGQELVKVRTREAKNTGKSSLLQRDENAEYNIVQVDAIRLDDFLAEKAPSGNVTLWIDVEGAASLVLEGAETTLKRCDVLIVETEGFSFWKSQLLVDEIVEKLQKQGFEAVLRDREYQDAQFNIVFIRETLAQLPEIKKFIGHSLAKADVSKSYISLNTSEPLITSVPVLIPCFNNPTYCAQMLEQLLALGCQNITFVDNASTYEPMKDFLNKAEGLSVRVAVERLNENLGPHVSIFTKERIQKLGRYFCVTDPDIQFNPALPNDFLEIMAEEMNKAKIGKIGFALNIGNRSKLKQADFLIGNKPYKIWEWEEQFWKKRLGFSAFGDPVYSAAVDTTFALYDTTRFDRKKILTSLRIGGRFTAEHLPWLAQETQSMRDADAYRASQKFSYYLR